MSIFRGYMNKIPFYILSKISKIICLRFHYVLLRIYFIYIDIETHFHYN